MHDGEVSRQRLGWWLLDLSLILAICLFLFFRGLGASPFYDKQEAREALVIWEMHHSGNWILPLRNGNEIPAKPPFFHWLGALVSQAVDRTDELTTRFPSAVLATLASSSRMWPVPPSGVEALDSYRPLFCRQVLSGKSQPELRALIWR